MMAVTLIEGIIGVATSLIASILYATVGGGYKRWFGQQITITNPAENAALADAEPLGEGFSFPVSGKLAYLPKDHAIWLLTESDSGAGIRPQGFFRVRYDPQSGTWHGRVSAGGARDYYIRVTAVIAPPTSQDYFDYYQTLGDMHKSHTPIRRIPPECKKRYSARVRVPANQKKAAP